jgi:pentatricopeptide repeat protein
MDGGGRGGGDINDDGRAATTCVRLGAGREVHCAFMRRFKDDNLLVWTALLDMYSKCRRVEALRKVFDRLSMRNLVCWNAMIIEHCVYGESDDGIKLFHEMIRPGEFCFPRLVDI